MKSLGVVWCAAALQLFLACSGSQRPSGPAVPAPLPSAVPGEVPAVASGSSAPTLAALLVPPPFSREVLDEQIERLAESTDLGAIPAAPAVGAPGPTIVVVDPRKLQVPQSELVETALLRDVAEGPAGRRVQAHQRVFARAPTAMMDRAGALQLRFETVGRTPGFSAYYGTVMPDGILHDARYRKQSFLGQSDAAGKRHRVDVPAHALLGEKYDVHDARSGGRGWIAWRVEILVPEEGASRIFDGTTPFRCGPVPCGRDAEFVQLPTFLAPPQVDLVGPDRVTVSFSTDAATNAVVLIQAEGDDIERHVAEKPATHHEIEIRGLAARTRYRYQVLVVDRRGEVTSSRGATFRTAPPSGDVTTPVTFVALSDARSGVGSTDERYVGTNRGVLRRLLQRGLEHGPDFVLFLGDLVDGYTTEPTAFRFELEAWVQTVAPVGAYVPIYESMGNHESVVEAWEGGWAIGRTGSESAEALFGEYVVNPRNAPQPDPGAPPYLENVYSFDHGAVHVAIVNSNYWWRSHPDRKDHPAFPRGQREGWVNDVMIDWLDQDLLAARQRGARYLFVGTHEPGFPNGGHTADAMFWNGEVPEVLQQRNKLFRVLSKHRVGVLFCGDEHNYSRTRVDEVLVPGMDAGLWQITSGGAGAPYYAQNHHVPWRDSVTKFDVRQHLVVVRATASRALVDVVAVGGEAIDSFELVPLAD